MAPETVPVASSGGPTAAKRVAGAASAVVLSVEALGSLSMWAPLPVAWFWVGARAFEATGSVAASGSVILLGLLVTVVLMMKALARLDNKWIVLRRRAGHDQAQGALTQVVVASATAGLLVFSVWYWFLSDAYLIPFMPNQH